MNPYIIDYSESKNRAIVFKMLFWGGVCFLIAMGGLIALDIVFHQGNTVAIIVIFASVFVIHFFVAILPNYLSNKKHNNHYQVIIDSDNISVIDSQLNKQYKYSFKDITELFTISYGYTIFGGRQINISGGKQLYISNVMNNYGLLLDDLTSKTSVRNRRIFKPIGSWVKNIY